MPERRKANEPTICNIYNAFQQEIEEHYCVEAGALLDIPRRAILMLPKHLFRYYIYCTYKQMGWTQNEAADFCKRDRSTFNSSYDLIIQWRKQNDYLYKKYQKVVDVLWHKIVERYLPEVNDRIFLNHYI